MTLHGAVPMSINETIHNPGRTQKLYTADVDL